MISSTSATLAMDNTTCKHRDDIVDLNYFTLFDRVIMGDFVKGAGYLFYAVHPNETSYENFNEVPDFYVNVSIIIYVKRFVVCWDDDG